MARFSIWIQNLFKFHWLTRVLRALIFTSIEIINEVLRVDGLVRRDLLHYDNLRLGLVEGLWVVYGMLSGRAGLKEQLVLEAYRCNVLASSWRICLWRNIYCTVDIETQFLFGGIAQRDRWDSQVRLKWIFNFLIFNLKIKNWREEKSATKKIFGNLQWYLTSEQIRLDVYLVLNPLARAYWKQLYLSSEGWIFF